MSVGAQSFTWDTFSRLHILETSGGFNASYPRRRYFHIHSIHAFAGWVL